MARQRNESGRKRCVLLRSVCTALSSSHRRKWASETVEGLGRAPWSHDGSSRPVWMFLRDALFPTRIGGSDFASRLARLPRDRLVQGGGRDSRCDIWGRPVSERLPAGMSWSLVSIDLAHFEAVPPAANSQPSLRALGTRVNSFHTVGSSIAGRGKRGTLCVPASGCEMEYQRKEEVARKFGRSGELRHTTLVLSSLLLRTHSTEKKSCWSQEVGTHRALEIEPRRHWKYRLDGTWGEPLAVGEPDNHHRRGRRITCCCCCTASSKRETLLSELRLQHMAGRLPVASTAEHRLLERRELRALNSQTGFAAVSAAAQKDLANFRRCCCFYLLFFSFFP